MSLKASRTGAIKIPVCSYYKLGKCRFGDACQFRHEGKTDQPPPCRFWLAGHCAKGDQCAFLHEDGDEHPNDGHAGSRGGADPSASPSSSMHAAAWPGLPCLPADGHQLPGQGTAAAAAAAGGGGRGGELLAGVLLPDENDVTGAATAAAASFSGRDGGSYAADAADYAAEAGGGYPSGAGAFGEHGYYGDEGAWNDEYYEGGHYDEEGVWHDGGEGYYDEEGVWQEVDYVGEAQLEYEAREHEASSSAAAAWWNEQPQPSRFPAPADLQPRLRGTAGASAAEADLAAQMQSSLRLNQTHGPNGSVNGAAGTAAAAAAVAGPSSAALPAPRQEQHWAGPSGPVDPAELPLCSAYTATGACHAGEGCPHVHGDLCSTCGRHSLHPYNPEEAEAHRQDCARRHQRLAARLRSTEVECGICLELVLSKAVPSERRFGLLACEHPFCLTCIRSWRANRTADVDSAVRTCPVCRKPTHFIVPSTVWPASLDEKEDIVAAYKDKLGSIDCRHFAMGSGTCPFGTSCFYRHAFPDGREEAKDPLMLRRYLSDEGVVKIVSGVKLSDWFDTPEGRAALSGRGRRRGARR